MDFKLRFDCALIPELAQRYSYSTESHIAEVIAPRVRDRGYYTKGEFLDVGRWKSARNQKWQAENAEEFIRTVTETALSTPNEKLRIEVLTLLRGVDWPVASVLLHFGSKDKYPILDYRALWSLSVDVPEQTYGFYNFSLWQKYTDFCRSLAQNCGVSMRTLDRALWQYSGENQPPKKSAKSKK
jgi:hypothetical protein